MKGGELIKILFIISCVWLIPYFFTHKDSTDTPKKRSGLGLYIDNATGCHYISNSPFGGLRPRLDKNGNHICECWEYENKRRNHAAKRK